MAVPFHFHVFVLTISTLSQIPISSSSSSSSSFLARGSSLSVDNDDDILVSPNGIFTAGFHQVGENAYGFAVWFSEQPAYRSRTVVWMANRDAPVNGKHSTLFISEDGNLVLTDAGDHQNVIWSTKAKSTSSLLQLQLHNTGNLVLNGGEENPLWQSFDHPTDTLLPNQLFTKKTQLVSSRSFTNYSSGFYKLFFDNDSILRLLYDGPQTTTVFWPHPSLRTWEVGRFQYIDSRRASLDSDGEFNSSDGFSFRSSDFGMRTQRIMKIDTDGNLRVYSFDERRLKWEVQWQALSHPCQIHGACGPNSLCSYSPDFGRTCACLHGYKKVDSQDWSSGCEPEFQLCTQDGCDDFIELRHVEFYGYDVRLIINCTLDACKKDCLKDDTCRGFQLGWRNDIPYCFIKTSLHNGYQMGVDYLMYIKLPKRLVSSFTQKPIIQSSFSCPDAVLSPIMRTYKTKHDMNSKLLEFVLVFGCMIGFIEIVCVVIFMYCSSKHPSATEKTYFPAATEFRKFTYSELKKATRNFSDEIGRGGASIVYKGRLADNRIAAIKRLTNTNRQGEAEFQAEISTIGRLNHMNLIQTLGYCAEGNHRLVVYEYMEKGSLAENLSSGHKLDWATRFDIAKGIAKGLAYLHEECLEWVLHCDVKPHNILLDANYNPKVADFGLSRLLDRRSGISEWNFSVMRGTRGYMAPEWVLNLPITSKVDVFSYGVVILEMITGRSPASMNENDEIKRALIDRVRDKIQGFDEIVDPWIRDQFNETVMENLVKIALQCVEEDREARPSMRQVVDMLLHV
ncbi:unnamed protein product [Lactuca saligna]|uniref:Receptor-like serine/threonine-protein kinase n=1 Tax=Lactuca saligna TaxID=75948 RepID=A0AA36E8V9_LACSI|nr:unnamed protein product [Lactuca saligna]